MWLAIEQLKTTIKKKKIGRVWIGKANKQFYKRLISDVVPGRVEYIAFVIDGGKGTGKTTKICSIYEFILKYLAKKNNEEISYKDNHPESNSVNLIAVRSLQQVKYHLDERPYQIVLIDDAVRYNNKITREVINDFHEIRHIYGQFVAQGVLIFLWTVQDNFAIQKSLRKDLSGYIWTDVPLTEHDRNFINRNSCYRGLVLLRNWSSKVRDEKKLEYMSRSIISTESWAGWLDIPQSKDSHFKPYHPRSCPVGIRFISPEEDELLLSNVEVTEKRVIPSGKVIFKLIETGDSFELIKAAYDRRKELCQKLSINLEEKYFEAFHDRFILGHDISSIAQKFGVSDAAIANNYARGGWLAKVKELYLGHAIEYLLTETIYQGYNRIAGNEHIDLRCDNIGVEVKVRGRKETPNESWLSNHSLELIEKGYTACSQCAGIEKFELILVIYRLENFRYYRYSVQKKSADSAVDSQSSVRSLQPPSPSSSSSFPSAVEVCIPSGESVLSGETVGDVESVEGSGEGGRGVEENLGKWGL